MKNTTISRIGNRDLISPTWITDHIEAVADALSAAADDDPDDDRHRLARLLNEALGGLLAKSTPPALTHDATDFEDADGWPFSDDDRWATNDDRDLDDILAELADDDDEPTPLDVLASDFALPALAGGSPEAFTPSDEDWSDYARHCDEQDRLDALDDARRCGLMA